jgi:hypothetical protein
MNHENQVYIRGAAQLVSYMFAYYSSQYNIDARVHTNKNTNPSHKYITRGASAISLL